MAVSKARKQRRGKSAAGAIFLAIVRVEARPQARIERDGRRAGGPAQRARGLRLAVDCLTRHAGAGWGCPSS